MDDKNNDLRFVIYLRVENKKLREENERLKSLDSENMKLKAQLDTCMNLISTLQKLENMMHHKLENFTGVSKHGKVDAFPKSDENGMNQQQILQHLEAFVQKLEGNIKKSSKS